MRQAATALGVGLVVGVLFAGLRLPIPAPPTLAGVAGIVGIFVGYLLVVQLTHPERT